MKDRPVVLLFDARSMQWLLAKLRREQGLSGVRPRRR